jgi:hypothetical protein
MIDNRSSQHLIRSKFGTLSKPDDPLEDHLGPDVMDASDPPAIDFALMTPPVLLGFHMHAKCWSLTPSTAFPEVHSLLIGTNRTTCG